MNLKNYIGVKTLAAFLRGVARGARGMEDGKVLEDAADTLEKILESELPWQLERE